MKPGSPSQIPPPGPARGRLHRARRTLGAALAACALGVVALGAGDVSAQPKDDAAGLSKTERDALRGHFRQGLALQAAGNWTAALAEYQTVAKEVATPQVNFNIAECQEKLGQLVSALGNYRLAAASAAADPAKAAEVNREAPNRIADLEARIPKLTMIRGKGAERASIQLDGTEIGTKQESTEISIDPGSHIIEAKIGGNLVFRRTVLVKEREPQSVEIKPNPALSPKPIIVDTEPLPVPPSEKPKPPPKSNARLYGAIIGSAGLVSTVVGVVFMGLRAGTISTLGGECQGSQCPPSAKSTADSGRTDTGLAEVTLGLGVAGMVTGVVLLVTAPPSRPKTEKAVSPRGVHLVASAPGASLGGLSVLGHF
jgi:hypothetical protein